MCYPFSPLFQLYLTTYFSTPPFSCVLLGCSIKPKVLEYIKPFARSLVEARHALGTVPKRTRALLPFLLCLSHHFLLLSGARSVLHKYLGDKRSYRLLTGIKKYVSKIMCMLFNVLLVFLVSSMQYNQRAIDIIIEYRYLFHIRTCNVLHV